MSLINQMLRDLEARHKNSESPEIVTAESLRSVVSRRSTGRLLAIILVGLVVGAGIWYWHGLIFGVQLKTQTPNTLERPELQTSGAEVTATIPSVIQPVGTAQSKVNQQSNSAGKLLSQAVISHRQVVASGQALQLLNIDLRETPGAVRLMFEFDQLPEHRIEKNTAGTQLLLVFTSATTRPKLHIPSLKGPLLNRISLQTVAQEVQLQFDFNNAVSVHNLQLPADALHGDRLVLDLQREQKNVAATEIHTEQQPKKQSVPQREVSSSTARVNKTNKPLTREQQAHGAYRAGLEQLKNADRLAAEANFSHALILAPRHLSARQQLIALLLEMQRPVEARKIVELGRQLHPDDPRLRKVYARMLLTNEQLPEAIAVLRAEPRPELKGDLEYHALLAALLQEVGNHSEAGRVYSQLLAVRPQEAVWWMGLAISLEQVGNADEARKAYRQALVAPGLNPNLNRYVRDRLQAL